MIPRLNNEKTLSFPQLQKFSKRWKRSVST